MFQRVFKKDYIEQLKNNICIDDYRKDKFPYDSQQTVTLGRIQAPENLLNKLDPTPTGDLQTAKAIYEAYQGISPLMAQEDNLWVYLTHVDLFPYVQKRWPLPENKSDEEVKSFIVDHWFHNSRNFLRTTFAGFWWRVYMTIDENRDNKYELTDTLFQTGQDFMTLRFGEAPLIRSHEAMVGILEFLSEHKELINAGFVAKGQYISRLFNQIGGYKLLSAMDRSFFKEELEKRYQTLLSVISTKDIHNKSVS